MSKTDHARKHETTDIIPAELLEKGAAYIEEHGLWQGQYWAAAATWQGALRKGAAACQFGSLLIATEGDYDAASQVSMTLTEFLNEASINWNDTPGRTAAEVADAMRACATGLRGES